MKVTLYWIAFNIVAYLGGWIVHVIVWNLRPAFEKDPVWIGNFDAWPIEPIPYLIIIIVAINLVVFGCLRPLDCQHALIKVNPIDHKKGETDANT